MWDSEQAEEAQRGQGGVGAAPEGGVTQDPSRFSLMCWLTFHFTSCPLTSGSLGNQRRQAQVPHVRLALWGRPAVCTPPSFGCQGLACVLGRTCCPSGWTQPEAWSGTHTLCLPAHGLPVPPGPPFLATPKRTPPLPRPRSTCLPPWAHRHSCLPGQTPEAIS